MQPRQVLRLGDPRLREVARELSREELLAAETRRLIDELIVTMEANQGLGLAAPQIGVGLRVAVVKIPENSLRYPGAPAFPLEVYVNPVWTVVEPEQQGFWEGCLSVPGLRGYVERPSAVRVQYWNREGESKEFLAKGFLATVFQHEFDHLDGVLFVDRLKDSRRFGFLEELKSSGQLA